MNCISFTSNSLVKPLYSPNMSSNICSLIRSTLYCFSCFKVLMLQIMPGDHKRAHAGNYNLRDLFRILPSWILAFSCHMLFSLSHHKTSFFCTFVCVISLVANVSFLHQHVSFMKTRNIIFGKVQISTSVFLNTKTMFRFRI